MVLSKYYRDGKVSSIGFDTLAELFAVRHKPESLTKIETHKSCLEDEERRKILESPEFLKFREELNDKELRKNE